MAVARSEAVQPSLWDRLVDDLPGIVTDIEALRKDLTKELGPKADLDALVEDGIAGLRRRSDLEERSYKLAQALILKCAEHSRIQASGVVVTPEVLREAVRRDIEMLFNIERLQADYLLTEEEELTVTSPDTLLDDFPEVRSSVLNFGVPSFSGRKGSDFDKNDLAREIRQVLRNFEPRLRSDTIKVEVSHAEKEGMRIDIDAVLLLSPVPERLRLSTMIDLENGQASTVQGEI